VADEFVNGESDVFCDLAEQDGRNISAFVKRNCCAPPVCVAILLVRTSLPSFNKSKLLEYRNNFCRFQDRKRSHLSRDLHSLRSDELAVEFWLAIF